MKKLISFVCIILFVIAIGCNRSSNEILIVDNWYKYPYKNFIYPQPSKYIFSDTSYNSWTNNFNKSSKFTTDQNYALVDSIILNTLADKIYHSTNLGVFSRGNIDITCVFQKKIESHGKGYMVSNFDVWCNNSASKYITVDKFGYIFKQYDMGPTYTLNNRKTYISNKLIDEFDPKEILKIIFQNERFFDMTPPPPPEINDSKTKRFICLLPIPKNSNKRHSYK